MARKSLPLSEVYRLIEPGPVVLVSTMGPKRPNVMAMSWHMMIEFEPPIIACVISDRDYTFDIISETKECVINIPTVELAKNVVGCGDCSGRKIDKFKRFGFTPRAGKKVSAPLVAECYANIECKVIDTRMVRQYCVFILEAVHAWIDASQRNPKMIHHRGKGIFVVDGRKLKLPFSKM